MSERTDYPAGVPFWVTALQHDCHAGAAFYDRLFGWESEWRDGFFTSRLRGRDVAGVAPLPPPEYGDAQPAWMTEISTDDAVAAAKRATEAGGSLLATPFDDMAVIADPAGAVFVISGTTRRAGAQLVNEPSAYAMSRLETPDTDAAAAFYGAVFGWTTEPFGDATMFRLPGYEGGEPGQPVSQETVAVMIKADEPRWHVDFWTDDADAIAQRATDGGGQVIAGPMEAPPFRLVVLADPSGAVFSASQLTLT